MQIQKLIQKISEEHHKWHIFDYGESKSFGFVTHRCMDAYSLKKSG